ncbi:MAG: hypothetical protein JWP87_2083 [Labilithrix sp.]|nr:hypothetical protein [Labilithrix sp.]
MVFVEVPFDVKAAFGKARAPVKVTIAAYAFRTTVAVYGGKSYVAMRREHREAAGVEAGQLVQVAIETDREPRVVEVPAELAAALKKNKRAREAWEGLSYSHQREHAEAIEGAKKAETRARRVERTVEMLMGRARG